jgi:hypothetical protein
VAYGLSSKCKNTGKFFDAKDNAAKAGETNISSGIRITRNFPDDNGILQTAYDDLNRFFSECGIPADGKYCIILEQQSRNQFCNHGTHGIHRTLLTTKHTKHTKTENC